MSMCADNISVNTGCEDIRRMKMLLGRVWSSFYGSFYRPTDVQIKSCAHILRGRNVLLSSYTASGKTEAYMAPLTERWGDNMRRGELCIMIVCPTRALANDLIKRIAPSLERCRIKVLLRTGDHANSPKDCGAGAVVTTLESFDSLMCRHAASLVNIKALVMEELHVFEGSPRGDQLSVLAERLDVLVHCSKAKLMEGTLASLNLPLQRLAVSATPGSYEVIAEKYLKGSFSLVHIHKNADFYRELCCYRNEGFESTAVLPSVRMRESLSKLRCCVQFCLKNKFRKMLVFVRSRAEAESMAAAREFLGVNPFGSNIYVHHSSVSTSLREEREKKFALQEYGLCLATSTLEVGIDIGSVEAVALTVPSVDLESFMQRIGRSGRRGSCAAVLCLYGNKFEEQCYLHIMSRVNSEKIFSEHPPFVSSVILQQAVSLICQSPNKSLKASVLYERLPQYLKKKFTEQKCSELISSLVSEDGDNKLCWVKEGRSFGTFCAGDRLSEAFLRGEIHHNISGVFIPGSRIRRSGGVTIELVDASTRRSLGSISARSASALKFVSLGGRNYKIISFKDGTADVIQCSSKEGAVPDFASQKSPSAGRLWSLDLAEFLGFSKDKILRTYVSYNDCRYYVYSHFRGSVWGMLFRAYLDCAGYVSFASSRSSGFVIVIKASSSDRADSPHPLEFDVSSIKKHFLTSELIYKLAQEFDLGPWAGFLDSRQLWEDIAALEKNAGFDEESLKCFDGNIEAASGVKQMWLAQSALEMIKPKD